MNERGEEINHARDFFAILAGTFISLQTVFNTRVSEQVGAWATTTIVLGLGLLTSLPIFFLKDDTPLFSFNGVKGIYLFGGMLGVVLVFSIMKAISNLGPAYAISIVLVAQIASAVIIDTFGLFGFPKEPLSMLKLMRLILMILGVFVFKLSKKTNRVLKLTQE